MAFYKIGVEKIAGQNGPLLHGVDKKEGKGKKRTAERPKENPLQKRGYLWYNLHLNRRDNIAEKESVVRWNSKRNS